MGGVEWVCFLGFVYPRMPLQGDITVIFQSQAVVGCPCVIPLLQPSLACVRVRTLKLGSLATYFLWLAVVITLQRARVSCPAGCSGRRWEVGSTIKRHGTVITVPASTHALIYRLNLS